MAFCTVNRTKFWKFRLRDCNPLHPHKPRAWWATICDICAPRGQQSARLNAPCRKNLRGNIYRVDLGDCCPGGSEGVTPGGVGGGGQPPLPPGCNQVEDEERWLLPDDRKFRNGWAYFTFETNGVEGGIF